VDELRDEFEGEGAVGIGRRELLRRGAALGAAMAVATPAVQALGRASAFAQTSPVSPPPPPPPPGGFTGISYVGLVFTCSGTTWRAKWEADGTKWVDVTSLGGPWEGLPDCPAPAGWDTATGLPGPGFNAVPNKPGVIQVAPTYINGELYSVTFTLPDSCTFQDGSGVAKGGAPSQSNSGGYCAPGEASGNMITYTAPT
jgi:hypothetical protein